MIIGSKLIYFAELPSTNTYAAVLLKDENPDEGTVIQAGFQSAGRGQAGNTWESEKDKNLLFSVILYPGQIEPAEQFLISQFVSLAVSEITEQKTGRKSYIKWPNDIYSGNDKIAGILIENSVIGNRIGHSVAGIGYNVNQMNFGRSIKNACSLRSLTGKEHDTGTLLKELLSALDGWYRQLLYGDRQLLEKEYLSRLYKYDEWFPFKASCGHFTGKIKGITPEGRLVIVTRENKSLEFSFKELEYGL